VKVTADKDNVAQAKDVAKDNPRVTVSVQSRLLAGFIAFILVVGIAGLATGKSNNGKLAFGNPLSFCVGVDNRTSNSQTQMVFWSATVLVAYLTTVILRAWVTNWDLLGGISIPTNLLAFSGLSALSFGGARAITVSKLNAAGADNSAQRRLTRQPKPTRWQKMRRPKPQPQPARWDLLKRHQTLLERPRHARPLKQRR
jgi:hypothetical protein